MAVIQQDAARLTWVDMDNRMETIFKPTNCNISRVTLKPSSPILILVYMYYTSHSWPIFHRQSSNIPSTFGTPCIGQVSTSVLADISVNQYSNWDQHISQYCRPILNWGMHKLHKIPFMFAVTQRQIAQREEKTLTLFLGKSRCKQT